MENVFTYIDLFAGIGGFHIALNSLGGRCVGFSEIDKTATKYYLANHTDVDADMNFGDIRGIKYLPPCDVITAGVPCQSWSIAGKKLGFNDSRGKLWDNAIEALKMARPKAFIFENVKHLYDQKDALNYILDRIADAGYCSYACLLDASDYGVPQSRQRMYIIGFNDNKYINSFVHPKAYDGVCSVGDILDDYSPLPFGSASTARGMGISVNENGFNDYFLFNDLRGGDTTIHSWELLGLDDKYKNVCDVLMKNRRKKKYGKLDGNPLSVQDLQELDSSITNDDVEHLAGLGILEEIDGKFDFRNRRISTGIDGINRIILPSSRAFPTLTASDSKDYVTTTQVYGETIEEYKSKFINFVYNSKNFRQINKKEALRLQGFPDTFILPDSRSKWMKLVGNAVAVPVIKAIMESVLKTGALEPPVEVVRPRNFEKVKRFMSEFASKSISENFYGKLKVQK